MKDHLEVENEYGRVTLTHQAVGHLVVAAVERRGGTVFLSNKKGKIISKAGRGGLLASGDAADQIEVRFDEEGELHLTLYVIIRFGSSIRAVTRHLMEEIRKRSEIALGKEPASITCIVSGMLSRHLARRNIRVEWHREDR